MPRQATQEPVPPRPRSGRPYTSTNNESCTFNRLPTDNGTVVYYVLVHAYQPYAGVTLKGEYFH